MKQPIYNCTNKLVYNHLKNQMNDDKIHVLKVVLLFSVHLDVHIQH
jgi:hypothetical protein